MSSESKEFRKEREDSCFQSGENVVAEWSISSETTNGKEAFLQEKQVIKIRMWYRAKENKVYAWMKHRDLPDHEMEFTKEHNKNDIPMEFWDDSQFGIKGTLKACFDSMNSALYMMKGTVLKIDGKEQPPLENDRIIFDF